MPPIRLAEIADVPGILEIYGPIVRDTVISFEYEIPTEAEMAHRLEAYTRDYPWLVWEESGRIAGYAYGSAHRSRAAYRWSVEVSAYVHPDFHRQGLGGALYRTLFALLELQGYHLALAGITQPNPRSEAFHEALGFSPIGYFREVGFKMGQWHDTGWWQLKLQAGQEPPSRPPLALDEARQLAEWSAILQGR